MKSPYPWFGGKATIAPDVWRAFGGIKNYVEPFFGGGAVLLAAPDGNRIETVNDINAWLCNFWRAVKADPDAVARYASDPVSELDLHARGDWLFYRDGVDVEFIERMRSDPDYYDAKSAGWWVWGQSSWIGDNWGRKNTRSIPHLADAGMGVNRKLPHLADAGKGVNRQLPHLANAGMGVTDTTRLSDITGYMRQLCERVSRVRVCCGDWSRVLGPSPTFKNGMTGIFLDPPYAASDRDSVYGEHDDFDIAHDVRKWCIENGDNPMLRIVLCGYEEHGELESKKWTAAPWRAHGGYSNQSATGNDNAQREVMWLSPHCVGARQEIIDFGGGE